MIFTFFGFQEQEVQSIKGWKIY